MNKRKYGLKTQFLIALLISFGAAVLTFLVMDRVSSAILDDYFAKSAYIGKQLSKYMDSFEAYVTKNNIAASDSEAIDSWRDSNKKLITIIYINRSGETLYDSLRFTWQNATDQDRLTENSSEQDQYIDSSYSENSWFFKREIAFSDGSATVSLYGYFDRWIYDIALIGEIILSAAVLCTVFICLMRRKINYVIQLEEEIKVLETGGLNFPVSVKGHDELASLADSLNQMRIALSENIKTEAAAVKSNYDLVAAVSHDLRTPLTSLALYLDLIHTGKYKSQEELNAYLEKSRRKVAQIKQMTDQLFERFYLEKDSGNVIEEPAFVRTIFEESLSNMVGYIVENGFEVKADIQWPPRRTSASSDYINRIFDNISSNILKYADPAFPVTLEVGGDDHDLQIGFSNHIRRLEEKPDSTEVGVENIRFMMHKMNGDCSISQSGNLYLICLRFGLEAENI